MNKKEFNEQLKDLIQCSVVSGDREMDLNEKIVEAKNQLLKLELDLEYSQENKGNSWTDEELKLVLSFPPTKENCLKLAKAFKRGYGSIEQIYRWATTSEKELKGTSRENDSFIKQIHRIYRELGWRA